MNFTCDATNNGYKGSCQGKFVQWMMNDSWSTGHFTLAFFFLSSFFIDPTEANGCGC